MNRPIRTLVVGVATTEELDPALPSAIRLAERVGAILHVVHVYDVPEPAVMIGDMGAPLSLSAEAVASHAASLEAALLDQARRFHAEPARLVARALTGSPHQRLTGYAAEAGADVLVVGATRRGRIWRNILGTTAERVLRHSTVPVLVLHQPFFHAVERVLLTTDLTALSAGVQERALDVIENLFGSARLEVRSLHVLPGRLPAALVEEMGRVGRAELAEFVAERRPRDYPIRPRVQVGDAPEAINVEADAWGADLIVLGTHGRSGLARYVFGSVAAAALRDAARNVLVIPALAGAAEASVPLASVNR